MPCRSHGPCFAGCWPGLGGWLGVTFPLLCWAQLSVKSAECERRFVLCAVCMKCSVSGCVRGLHTLGSKQPRRLPPSPTAPHCKDRTTGAHPLPGSGAPLGVYVYPQLWLALVLLPQQGLWCPSPVWSVPACAVLLHVWWLQSPVASAGCTRVPHGLL